MSLRSRSLVMGMAWATVGFLALLFVQQLTQGQTSAPGGLNNLQIARDLGGSDNFNVSVYGLNAQVPNGSFAIVGPGSLAEYPWPVAALPVRVAAGGDPNDTNGGSGAWSVDVECLDDDFNRDFHTLVLDGANASSQTPRNCIRVNGAALSQDQGSVGTQGGANIGNIVIEQVGVGDPLRTISPGVGIDETFVYTVPRGHTALLLSYEIGITANNPATVEIYRRPRADITTAPFGAFSRIRRISGVEGYFRHTLEGPPMFDSKTDFFVQATGMTGQTAVTSGALLRLKLK